MTKKEVAKIIFNKSKPESNVGLGKTTLCDTTEQADGGQLVSIGYITKGFLFPKYVFFQSVYISIYILTKRGI